MERNVLGLLVSAGSTTLAGRQLAETNMESTCVITRSTPGAPGNVDHATGLATDGSSTIYAGSCRLRFPSVRPQQSLVEGQQLVRDRGILSLPLIGSSSVRAGDVAVVTLSTTLDPGTTVTVEIAAPFTQTHSTARRFPVEVTN
jgi:hypothetical protein